MKKRILWLVVSCFMVAAMLLVSCGPAEVEEEEAAPTTRPTPDSAPKTITLDDATDILNLSLLLPSRFEQVDAASEGLSNRDLGLGQDVSEVQVFLSEEPMQVIYCYLGISKSRTEAAVFDRQIEDEYQIESLLVETIKAGAEEQGGEATVPSVEITHPYIGDSALFGEGYIESYGFHFGFDTLWFRDNTVYVFVFTLYMSADKVPLPPIGEEIAKRIGRFSQ